MEIKELKSGRKLGLEIASFDAANKLRKVIQAELLEVRLEIDPKKISLELDLAKADAATLDSIKNVIFKLMSSDPVERSFWACAGRCTLDRVKVAPEVFEAEEARGDFLPVAWEVIRANVAPFFASLDLGSLIGGGRPIESPPST